MASASHPPPPPATPAGTADGDATTVPAANGATRTDNGTSSGGVGGGVSGVKEAPLSTRRRRARPKRIVVGVCAMDKKTRAAPMQNILSRLVKSEFKWVIFGDDAILDKEVEEWPRVDCLMSFYSTGFPLEKAERYVALRRPMLINDLSTEHLLRDRREFYSILEKFEIPTARHMVVDRENGQELKLLEAEDYIVLNGTKLQKPFVEKPVDAENHNVHVYYPRAMGGGVKELFRKVKSQSSRFVPDRSSIRRDGSYIYEEFLPTGGTDIKVYVVGPNYAHAEARKSPALDGVVERDAQGKETRYPILLTREEKVIARRVCLAFRQNVCGFDLLRTPSGSFVCDVNGWSFVKKSHKYYDDAAAILTDMMLNVFAPQRLPALQKYRSKLAASRVVQPLNTSGVPLRAPRADRQLRCVMAVVRHGDRTPKQKLKLSLKFPTMIDLHRKYARGPREDVKLKSAMQLQDVLEAVRAVVDSGLTDGDKELSNGFLQIRQVLEFGGHFSGINRKVQLKPVAWRDRTEAAGATGDADGGSAADAAVYGDRRESFDGSSLPATEEVTKVQFICKWGGVLTHAGKVQAESLGQRFRLTMYPGSEMGLVRLHSTFRHDLKIYASDEGRVQMTAAAFAKGFLDLEGELTPILASLVRIKGTQGMLDDTTAVTAEMDGVKDELREAFSETRDSAAYACPAVDSRTPTSAASSMTRSASVSSLQSEGGGSVGGASMSSLHGEGFESGDIAPSALRETLLRKLSPEGTSLSVVHALRILGFDPQRSLTRIESLITKLTSHLDKALHETGVEDGAGDAGSAASDDGLRLEEFDVPEPGSVAPCGNETLWLAKERWRKLDREFYNKKKQRFDLSKVPDVYDCIKYDLLHNKGFGSKAARTLRRLARAAADIVIPLEYGISSRQKLVVACGISRLLASKIAVDMRSVVEHDAAREEDMLRPTRDAGGLWIGSRTPRGSAEPGATNVSAFSLSSAAARHARETPVSPTSAAAAAATAASPKAVAHSPASLGSMHGEGLEDQGSVDNSGDETDSSTDTPREGHGHDGDLLIGSGIASPPHPDDAPAASPTPATRVARSGSAEKPSLPVETVHHLDDSVFHDAGYSTAGIEHQEPHVRTRLYFTSESHLHAMLNVLRFTKSGDGGLLSAEALKILSEVSELDYMSHFVFRMFEDTKLPLHDDKKYTVEILFSPGAGNFEAAIPALAVRAASHDVGALELSFEDSFSDAGSKPGSVHGSDEDGASHPYLAESYRPGIAEPRAADKATTHTLPIAPCVLLAKDVPYSKVVQLLDVVSDGDVLRA